MSVRTRKSGIAVVWPNRQPCDLASESFTQGGRSENDLLAKTEREKHSWRLIFPFGRLPDTIISALHATTGMMLQEIVEIPAWKESCPLEGYDKGSNVISLLGKRRIIDTRAVKRGVLLVLEAYPDEQEDNSSSGRYPKRP